MNTERILISMVFVFGCAHTCPVDNSVVGESNVPTGTAETAGALQVNDPVETRAIKEDTGGRLKILGSISKFTTFYDKAGEYTIKVFEMNGIDTVAMNHLTLLIAVTNDVGGPEGDVREWWLGHFLSEIHSITSIPWGIRIHGIEDVEVKGMETITRETVYDIKYSLIEGKVAEELKLVKY